MIDQEHRKEGGRREEDLPAQARQGKRTDRCRAGDGDDRRDRDRRVGEGGACWRSLSVPGLQVMQVMMAESVIALGGPTGNTTQTGSGLGTGCGPGR